MTTAGADALNQELAQLVGERRELGGRQLSKIRRQLNGFEQRVRVGWDDHWRQFIPPGTPAGIGRACFCSAIATDTWPRCGNAVGPAIVVHGLPAASSMEQLGRLHNTGPPGAMTLTFRDTALMDSGVTDEGYQDRILPHVSRTFALTIPQLPPRLRVAVTNAYLLCRIADTIEDQTVSSAALRLGLLHRFVGVLRGEEEAQRLARDLLPRLAAHTLPAERELILNTERIVRLCHGLEPV